jgi:transcriptional regulator
MHDLVDAHPWALLVDNGEEGPFATNLPLVLDRARGQYGTLTGHLARANEHAGVLQSAREPSLAIFQGPYSYVTASWYPRRDLPSTYYYTAVHCYGRLRFQTDAELEASLVELTGRSEAPFPNGWRVDEIPEAEIARRLPAILGFEMTIDRIEGKFKLGQDEPRDDALSVAEHLERSGGPAEQALARLIRAYNAGRPGGARRHDATS